MKTNILQVNIIFILLYIIIDNLKKYNFLANYILLILILVNHKNTTLSILIMILLLSRYCIQYHMSEGFLSGKVNIEVENEEEEIKKYKKEKDNDLILKAVKEDFITKLLGDGLIQKKKNKETFETKIPTYKIDTNVDTKINQLEKAINLFKQQLNK